MYKYLGDTGIQMYTIFNKIAIIIVCLFNLINYNKKMNCLGRGSEYFIKSFSKNSKRGQTFIKAFFVFIEIMLVSDVQYHFSINFNGIFGDLVGTGANYFGALFFAPIFVALLCFLTGIDVFKQMDLITPAYPLALIFAKLACFFQGCCEGFVCSFGLYNHTTKQTEFPVQLVEMSLAAVIFIFLMFWRKKAKEGTVFPIYIIIYSATRFFSEFLRQDENVFFILKKYHIICLVGIGVGIFWLYVIKKYKERIRLFFTDYFDAVEDTFDDVAVRLGIKRERDIIHHGKQKKRKNDSYQGYEKKTRVSNMKKWILIWTLGLIGQIGWNVEGTWFNTFVYEKIDKTPDILTPMLTLSAFASMVAVFIFGTIIDRTGKRRTFISSGYFIWGLLIGGFGFIPLLTKTSLSVAIIVIVVVDMLISFFASIGDVGFGTWITDTINDKNMGQIGAALAVQPVLASLIANVFGGMLIGRANNYIRLFLTCGTILSFLGLFSILLFDKKENKKPKIKRNLSDKPSKLFDLKSIFNNKELFWVNISVAVFFIGFSTYFPHLGNFLIEYLGYSADQMGLIEAVPMILAMLATVPVSKFINRNKFIEVTLFSLIFGLLGNAFIFTITPDKVDTTKYFNLPLFGGIFLVAVGYIVMLQATRTWTKTLYPKESKGQSEGLWVLFQGFIPTLVGTNVGEYIIKNNGGAILNEVTMRYEYIPDSKIFLIGAIISTFSIIPIIMVKIYVDKKQNIK